MLKHEYMVVYHYQGGFGRMCITSEKKIEDYTDIEKLDQHIRNKKPEFTGLIVTDFKFLRTYESLDAKAE